MKILIFILMIISIGFPASSQSMKPGMWKSNTHFKVNGIPLPEEKGEECITAKEAKDAKSTIEKELKKNGCALTKWQVVNHQLDAALKCKSKDLDAKGKLKGHFSGNRYDLKGEAEGTYQNIIPSVASVKLTGEWVSTCTN